MADAMLSNTQTSAEKVTNHSHSIQSMHQNSRIFFRQHITCSQVEHVFPKRCNTSSKKSNAQRKV